MDHLLLLLDDARYFMVLVTLGAMAKSCLLSRRKKVAVVFSDERWYE
jgi:hypothetical protein